MVYQHSCKVERPESTIISLELTSNARLTMKSCWSRTGFAPMQIYTASNCLLYKKTKQNVVLIVYHIRWSSTLFGSLCVAVWLKACELTAETLGLGDISPRTGSNFSWHSIRLKWMEQPECTAHILRAIQRQAWDFWLQSIFCHCTILLKLYSKLITPLKHIQKHRRLS